jgi:DNA-binding MarR family transcriptional regulator
LFVSVGGKNYVVATQLNEEVRMSDTGDVPARLALAVGRLSRRLRAANGGLSHGLLSALATVSKQGPIRLAELAHFESISAPSTTRLVAELEAQELVTRETDPDDGRAVLVSITEKGETLIYQARSARAAMVQELFSHLSDDEVASITAALPALEHTNDVAYPAS